MRQHPAAGALLLLAFLSVLPMRAAAPGAPRAEEVSRWKAEAARTTIVRDNWGIAHVSGESDADAVFGMEYAQAEDDFPRIETNYLDALGRRAEAEGEAQVMSDLRMKLFVDPGDLQKQYQASPEWLRKLMDAFADGLNYYLYTHPQTKPEVLTRFEPWMALAFTEGSIGGDIAHIRLSGLEAFYGKGPGPQVSRLEEERPPEPTGSNGMAIAPANTASGHALLLINPHTTFYFRSELQMASREGLNVYGAATWGQFFLYQGFNEHLGWMHTTSTANAFTDYLETVEKKNGHFAYRYGGKSIPVTEKTVTVAYRTAHGLSTRSFLTYRTAHGPVVGEQANKWMTVRLMQDPIHALIQDYTRMKAADYGAFRSTLDLHTNSSNNTLYADDRGNIAFFHGNFIPRRDPRFDWGRPVDGSNPATEWQGLLSVEETPHLLNPKSGWVYNCNDWPWAAAGPGSLRREDFPAYVDRGHETARGRHAVMVLEGRKGLTLDSLRDAAYDSYLPWFDTTLPPLLKAWEESPASDPLKAQLAEPVAVLRSWDRRWALDSVATSLAVFWGDEMQRRAGEPGQGTSAEAEQYVARLPPRQLLEAFSASTGRLRSTFGSWKTPWGEINRVQRLNDRIDPEYSDAAPSLPVAFTSSVWGSLAAFGAQPYAGSRKWYGLRGNSFVAVVEFGPRVRAKAVSTGGASGDPASVHFRDQMERYAQGNLREVYFYPSDLEGHVERQYHPGS